MSVQNDNNDVQRRAARDELKSLVKEALGEYAKENASTRTGSPSGDNKSDTDKTDNKVDTDKSDDKPTNQPFGWFNQLLGDFFR